MLGYIHEDVVFCHTHYRSSFFYLQGAQWSALRFLEGVLVTGVEGRLLNVNCLGVTNEGFSDLGGVVAPGVEGRVSKDSSLGVDTEAGSVFFFKKVNKDVCLFMFISIRAVSMTVT